MEFTFRLCAKVRFNRVIDREKDYISPGGYEFKTADKNVQFDFKDYYGTVSKDDPTILDYYQENPDYSEFEDLKTLTKEDLRKIVGIEEFFIYTEEAGETDLAPVELLDLYFEIIPLKGEIYEIHVAKTVYEDANQSWKEWCS